MRCDGEACEAICVAATFFRKSENLLGGLGSHDKYDLLRKQPFLIA